MSPRGWLVAGLVCGMVAVVIMATARDRTARLLAAVLATVGLVLVLVGALG